MQALVSHFALYTGWVVSNTADPFLSFLSPPGLLTESPFKRPCWGRALNGWDGDLSMEKILPERMFEN